jgi:hypothetical protein
MYASASLSGSTVSIRRSRPTWFRVAAARPCVMPAFGHGGGSRAFGEPKSPWFAHEPYKWMRRIRSEG